MSVMKKRGDGGRIVIEVACIVIGFYSIVFGPVSMQLVPALAWWLLLIERVMVLQAKL